MFHNTNYLHLLYHFSHSVLHILNSFCLASKVKIIAIVCRFVVCSNTFMIITGSTASCNNCNSKVLFMNVAFGCAHVCLIIKRLFFDGFPIVTVVFTAFTFTYLDRRTDVCLHERLTIREVHFPCNYL